MKYLMILTILLVFGCSSDPTGEVVKDIDLLDDTMDCPDCDVCEECKVCKTCPECEKCEKCKKCPTCPDHDDPVELELDSMRLSKKQMPDVEEHEQDFELTAEQYNDFKDTDLTFEARCSDANSKLRIKVNNRVVYNKVPKCRETIEVEVEKRDVKSGENTLTVEADVEENYRLTDIVLEIEDEIEFKDVWLEKRITENIQIEELEDVRIYNFVEMKVKLSKNDVKQDLVLEFDADKNKGRMIILVNKKEVFDGTPDDDNEVVIDNKYLDDGTNTIKFIGVDK